MLIKVARKPKWQQHLRWKRQDLLLFSSGLSFDITGHSILFLKTPKVWFYNFVGRTIDRRKVKK